MKIATLLFFCLLAQVANPISSCANESFDKLLPPPRTDGGMPLMQALRERQSLRSFSEQGLPDQLLSDLLWAAFGINRPDSGRRTAPSARNWQEVDVYVVMKDHSYVYEPESHSLKHVVKGDLRSLTGRQEFAATAPLNLVFAVKILGHRRQDFPFPAISTDFGVQ